MGLILGLPSREDPLEEGMVTHSSILAEKSCRQRSLAGYGPWVAESDTTECLNTAHTVASFLADTARQWAVGEPPLSFLIFFHFSQDFYCYSAICFISFSSPNSSSLFFLLSPTGMMPSLYILKFEALACKEISTYESSEYFIDQRKHLVISLVMLLFCRLIN